MILMVLKHRRPLPTPEEAMHNLLEEETTASLTKELRDACMEATLVSQRGGYCGCGGLSGRGGCSGTGDSHESKCTYCKIDSHTTDTCRKRKRAQEVGNNDEYSCFHSGLPGYVKVDCISYQRIKEWWRVKKATTIAALATTGDCDSLLLSACAIAATAAAATPRWVIDSGASHTMCNDRSSHSALKTLALPIVIELGKNNLITATYYGFVDVIEGYQVETLHTSTF
jgi:hypothetical protein